MMLLFRPRSGRLIMWHVRNKRFRNQCGALRNNERECAEPGGCPSWWQCLVDSWQGQALQVSAYIYIFVDLKFMCAFSVCFAGFGVLVVSAYNYTCHVHLQVCVLLFLFCFLRLIPCRKFRSPYLGKTTAAAGAVLPIPTCVGYCIFSFCCYFFIFLPWTEKINLRSFWVFFFGGGEGSTNMWIQMVHSNGCYRKAPDFSFLKVMGAFLFVCFFFLCFFGEGGGGGGTI